MPFYGGPFSILDSVVLRPLPAWYPDQMTPYCLKYALTPAEAFIGDSCSRRSGLVSSEFAEIAGEQGQHLAIGQGGDVGRCGAFP